MSLDLVGLVSISFDLPGLKYENLVTLKVQKLQKFPGSPNLA